MFKGIGVSTAVVAVSMLGLSVLVIRLMCHALM